MIGGRWLQSLLFETSAADPLVLGAAAGVMLAVARGRDDRARASGVPIQPGNAPSASRSRSNSLSSHA